MLGEIHLYVSRLSIGELRDQQLQSAQAAVAASCKTSNSSLINGCDLQAGTTFDTLTVQMSLCCASSSNSWFPLGTPARLCQLTRLCTCSAVMSACCLNCASCSMPV